MYSFMISQHVREVLKYLILAILKGFVNHREREGFLIRSGNGVIVPLSKTFFHNEIIIKKFFIIRATKKKKILKVPLEIEIFVKIFIIRV